MQLVNVYTDALLSECEYDGFPVLDGDIVIGFITRYRLRQAIGL